MQTVGIPVVLSRNKPGNNVERSQDASSNSRNASAAVQKPSSMPSSNQFNNNKSTSLGNLSFINIVGLPYHPRQASVPSTSSKNANIVPSHFRNASESSVVVPPRPPRASTSNSGAKSAKIRTNKTSDSNRQIIDLNNVSGKEASATTTNIDVRGGTTSISKDESPLSTWTNPNSNGGTESKNSIDDASHRHKNDGAVQIDVDFYRAIPTMISSVPTIQCLNVNSKNVSNVQIMPLSADLNSSCNTIPCGKATFASNSQVTVKNNERQTPTQLISGPSTSTSNNGGSSNTINNNNNSCSSETVSSVYLRTPTSSQRTFTSTEAQTDDTILFHQNNDTSSTSNGNKERRRRERRERRQNRRANPVRASGDIATQTTTNCGSTATNNNVNNTALPDILDSHLPPPYTTHPNTLQRGGQPPLPNLRAMGMIPPQVVVSPPPPQMLGGVVPPTQSGLTANLLGHVARQSRSAIVPNSVPHVSFPPPNLIPGQVPLVQNVPDANSRFRFALPVGQYARDHFSDDEPKNCCGILTWKPGSLKWLIASIALVAIGCVLVGTALGTMRPVGRDHITLALLMIGIGLVLVTISGVAWRLASQNATSCRTMLGIGSLESVEMCTRRFVPRLPPSYGRPHHPYAAMMYPEFQYRPPPPSYQASMQEYRLRLLLIDRGNTPQIQTGTQSAVSPPPTYRSHAGSLMRDRISTRADVAWSEYSCPPSYRSQTYSTRLGNIPGSVSVHTRDPSLTISEQTNDNAIDVVNILRNSDEDVRTMSVDIKADENSSPYKLILSDCGGNFENNKEENLVTIVQTDDHNPVIVTVSGSASTDNIGDEDKSPSEIQILAHL